MKTFIRYITFPLIVGILIFIATCVLGPSDIPDMPEGVPWDKLVHFAMFFLLSSVSIYDYYRLHNGSPNTFRWLFWGFVLPIVYGGIIEILQGRYFSRSCDIYDWLADVMGSLVATILFVTILRKRNK